MESNFLVPSASYLVELLVLLVVVVLVAVGIYLLVRSRGH